MNSDPSPGNPPEKRAILPGCAVLIFDMLRKFWLTEITLLLVILFGLFKGWFTQRQWSDGFFIAAVAQMMVAFISMQGSLRETTDSAFVRYGHGGDINETRQQLILDTLHKESFGLRAFIGGLLTILIAFFALRI